MGGRQSRDVEQDLAQARDRAGRPRADLPGDLESVDGGFPPRQPRAGPGDRARGPADCRRARLPMLQLTAHHAVGYTHFYRGEYEEALHHATEGLPLFNLKLEKEIADKFEFSSSCALYCYQAEALQMLGRAAEADKSLRNLRALTEDLQHDHYNASVAYSLSMQCFFFHARDDVDEVRRLATEARKISRTEGFKLWVSVADIFLAWASARSGGNPVEALEKIRAAKTHYDATRTHITELE